MDVVSMLTCAEYFGGFKIIYLVDPIWAGFCLVRLNSVQYGLSAARPAGYYFNPCYHTIYRMLAIHAQLNGACNVI